MTTSVSKRMGATPEMLAATIARLEAENAELRARLEAAEEARASFANTVRLLTEENLAYTIPAKERAEAKLTATEDVVQELVEALKAADYDLESMMHTTSRGKVAAALARAVELLEGRDSTLTDCTKCGSGSAVNGLCAECRQEGR